MGWGSFGAVDLPSTQTVRHGGVLPICLASPTSYAFVYSFSFMNTDVTWPEDLLALELAGRKTPLQLALVFRLITAPSHWSGALLRCIGSCHLREAVLLEEAVSCGSSVGQWVQIQGKWHCSFFFLSVATLNSGLAAGRQAKLIFIQLCNLNCLRNGLARWIRISNNNQERWKAFVLSNTYLPCITLFFFINTAAKETFKWNCPSLVWIYGPPWMTAAGPMW